MQSGEFDNPELPRPVSHRLHGFHSKYDAYLNFLKNQTPGASMASTAELGDTDFKTLESKVPSGTTSKNHAKLAPLLQI